MDAKQTSDRLKKLAQLLGGNVTDLSDTSGMIELDADSEAGKLLQVLIKDIADSRKEVNAVREHARALHFALAGLLHKLGGSATMTMSEIADVWRVYDSHNRLDSGSHAITHYLKLRRVPREDPSDPDEEPQS